MNALLERIRRNCKERLSAKDRRQDYGSPCRNHGRRAATDRRIEHDVRRFQLMRPEM